MAKQDNAGVNFDFDVLDDAIQNAPTAGYGPNVNFGKCTYSVQVISWSGEKGEKRTMNTRPLKKNQPVNKDKGEYVQIEFMVDVPELNPKLENPYKRRVDVRDSGAKAKTDWTETVLPSLISTFGKDWSKVLAKGVYVQVEDIETVQLDKEGNPKGFTSSTSGNFITNTAPRFVAAYKSKTECEAARAARFASRSEDQGNGNSDDGAIPDSVIADAKGLMKAVDEAQARDIFSNTPPFNLYDVDELVKAATF